MTKSWGTFASKLVRKTLGFGIMWLIGLCIVYLVGMSKPARQKTKEVVINNKPITAWSLPLSPIDNIFPNNWELFPYSDCDPYDPDRSVCDPANRKKRGITYIKVPDEEGEKTGEGDGGVSYQKVEQKGGGSKWIKKVEKTFKSLDLESFFCDKPNKKTNIQKGGADEDKAEEVDEVDEVDEAGEDDEIKKKDKVLDEIISRVLDPWAKITFKHEEEDGSMQEYFGYRPIDYDSEKYGRSAFGLAQPECPDALGYGKKKLGEALDMGKKGFGMAKNFMKGKMGSIKGSMDSAKGAVQDKLAAGQEAVQGKLAAGQEAVRGKMAGVDVQGMKGMVGNKISAVQGRMAAAKTAAQGKIDSALGPDMEIGPDGRMIQKGGGFMPKEIAECRQNVWSLSDQIGVWLKVIMVAHNGIFNALFKKLNTLLSRDTSISPFKDWNYLIIILIIHLIAPIAMTGTIAAFSAVSPFICMGAALFYFSYTNYTGEDAVKTNIVWTILSYVFWFYMLMMLLPLGGVIGVALPWYFLFVAFISPLFNKDTRTFIYTLISKWKYFKGLFIFEFLIFVVALTIVTDMPDVGTSSMLIGVIMMALIFLYYLIGAWFPGKPGQPPSGIFKIAKLSVSGFGKKEDDKGWKVSLLFATLIGSFIAKGLMPL